MQVLARAVAWLSVAHAPSNVYVVDTGFAAHSRSGASAAALPLGFGGTHSLAACRPNDSASRAVLGAIDIMRTLLSAPHAVVLLLTGHKDETRHVLEAFLVLTAALRTPPAVTRPLVSQHCTALSAVAAAAAGCTTHTPATAAGAGAPPVGRLRRASVGAFRRIQAALGGAGKGDNTAALAPSAMLSSASSGDVTGVITALVLGGVASAALHSDPPLPSPGAASAAHTAQPPPPLPPVINEVGESGTAVARTPPSPPTEGGDMPTRRRRSVHSADHTPTGTAPRVRSRSIAPAGQSSPLEPPSHPPRARRFSLASLRATVAGGGLLPPAPHRGSSNGSSSSTSPVPAGAAGGGSPAASDAPVPMAAHGVGGHKALPPVFTQPPSPQDVAAQLQGSDWQAAVRDKVQRGHVWLHHLVFSCAPKATAQTPTNPSHFTPSVMLFGVDSSGNTTLVYSSMVLGKRRYPGGAGPVSIPLHVAAVGQLLVKVYHIAEEGDGSAEEGAQRVLLLQFPLHSARLTPPGTPPGTPFVSSIHLQGDALGPSVKMQPELFPSDFSLSLVASGMGADTAAALREGKCSPLTAAAGMALPDPVAAGQLPPLSMVCSNAVCTAHVPVSLAQARGAARGARRRRRGLDPDAEVSDDDEDWGAEDLQEVEHGTPEEMAVAGAAVPSAGPRRRRRSVTAAAGGQGGSESSVTTVTAATPAGRGGGGGGALCFGAELLLGSRTERAAGVIAGADSAFYGAVACPDCGMQLTVSPLLLPVAGIGAIAQLTAQPIEARAAPVLSAYPAPAGEDENEEDGSLWDIHRRVRDIPVACLCAQLVRYAGISIRVVDAMHSVQLVPPRVFSLVCRESYDMGESETDMMSTLMAISDEIAGVLAAGGSLEDAHEQLWQAVRERAHGAGMRTDGLSADWSRMWSLVGVVATLLSAGGRDEDLLLDAVPGEYCGDLRADDTAGLLRAAVQWVFAEHGGMEACHGAAERAVHGSLWAAVSDALTALRGELVAQLQGDHGVMLMSQALSLATMNHGSGEDVLLGANEGGGGGYTSEEGAAAAEDSEQARAARRVALVYALPQHIWGEEGCDVGEQSSCVVCCSDFENGDNVRETGCGHVFHCGCVDPWLLQAGSCPICKAGLAGESDD